MNAKLLKIGVYLAGIALIVASLIYFLDPFLSAMDVARDARLKIDIASVSMSLAVYKDRNGTLPSTSQGLEALVARPSGNPVPKDWQQLMANVPTDAWGNAYRYERPGKHHPESFDLYTTGGPHRKVAGNW